MAYETSNPPVMLAQAGTGNKMWLYLDGDASTAIDAAGYFTNGYSLGMRAGDVLIAVDNDSSFSAAILFCNAATSDSDVDFTDGTTVASTDSD